MFVVDLLRQRVSKIFTNDRVLGITAVAIPAGKLRVRTKILEVLPAIAADAVGSAQPCNSDAIAGFEPMALRAKLFDDTDDLMSGNDARMFGREVALRKVKIGAADAAGDDPHQDFALARNGTRFIHETQRIGLDWSGLL